MFPDGWTRRCSITISSAHIDATLTDFTVVITEADLPSEMFDADGTYPALANGGDVRFSSDASGNTPLAIDIRYFDTDNDPANGKADIAVKVPSLSGSSDTTIYVWYNYEEGVQPNDTDLYGSHNAYDDNYVAVYSLHEDPSGTAPQFLDRTSTAAHATATGTPTIEDAVAYQGPHFNGSSEFITAPEPSLTNSLTVSCFVKLDATGTDNPIWSMESGSYDQSSDAYTCLRADASDTGTGNTNCFASCMVNVDTDERRVVSDTDTVTTNWTHVGVLWDSGSEHELYVDGALNATDDATLNGPIRIDTLAIGRGNEDGYLDGTVDEFRVSNVKRSAAWMEAEYQNLRTSSNTFFTTGTPQTIGEAFATEVQKFATDNLVTLFEIDTTALGGEYLRFTSSAWEEDPIVFDGYTYSPVPVEAEGFELSSSGTLPTPILRVLNTPALQAGVISLDDMLGAVVYRIRTFRTFLDDGDTPDPTAVFPIDVYKIDRKVTQNKVYIEWELAASIDQEGRKIPARQIIKDYCTHIYRMYNAETMSFDYTKATCPYVGTDYYDTTDTAVAQSADRCGKRLSSCKKRFGDNAELPIRAFPGVADAR